MRLLNKLNKHTIKRKSRMKVVATGLSDKHINCITVSGLFVNRWCLRRSLSKMPDVKIRNGAILKNFIKDKPSITFEFKGFLFTVEPDYPDGNQFEIMQIEARPVKELFEIQEYLNAHSTNR